MIALRNVCVFCGSRTGRRPVYRDAAVALAGALVQRGIGLVYGGGGIGLMNVLADAVLAAGGKVVGVVPRLLRDLEAAHGGLTELHVVETMHERKAMMAARSDAVIALPGGFGTIDELFEALTWTQLGIHGKPCGLLNTAGYFAELLGFIDRAVAEEFVTPAHRNLLVVADDPDALLDALVRFQLPAATQQAKRRLR